VDFLGIRRLKLLIHDNSLHRGQIECHFFAERKTILNSETMVPSLGSVPTKIEHSIKKGTYASVGAMALNLAAVNLVKKCKFNSAALLLSIFGISI